MSFNNVVHTIRDWLAGNRPAVSDNITLSGDNTHTGTNTFSGTNTLSGRVKLTGNPSVNARLTVTTSAFTLGTSLIGKSLRFTTTAGSRHKRVTLPSASGFTCGDQVTLIMGISVPSSNGISVVAGKTSIGKGLNGTSKLLKSTSRIGIGGSVTLEVSGYGWRIAHREYSGASNLARGSLSWLQGAN